MIAAYSFILIALQLSISDFHTQFLLRCSFIDMNRINYLECKSPIIGHRSTSIFRFSNSVQVEKIHNRSSNVISLQLAQSATHYWEYKHDSKVFLDHEKEYRGRKKDMLHIKKDLIECFFFE